MASDISFFNRSHLRPTPLLAAIVLTGCDAGANSLPPSPPQAVETMTIAFQSQSRTWSYSGTVKPRYQTDLGFRVAGKITSRLVEVGDEIQKGQVLARLDPADFEIAIAAQNAEFQAALTSRDETAAALQRFQKLFADGHVAQAALDQRRSAAAEAAARLERAEREMDLARNQLVYTTLTSDSDGVVTSLPAEVGQVVSTGQLVARIARRDTVEVEVALPEQDVEAAKHAIAEANIWSDGDTRLPLTLREVAPDADPISRTFRARFSIDQTNRAPAFGRTATVHLRSTTTNAVAALPLSAISGSAGSAAVWVVSDDGKRARPQPVVIQSLEKDRAIVSSGLRAGDRIVAFGVHMLDADKPIRPVETRPLISPK